MIALQPWATSLAVLISNCGFWLYCYNRVNALGLPRTTTKRIEKLLVFLCFAIPCFIFAYEHRVLLPWLFASPAWWPTGSQLFSPWGAFCLIFAACVGPVWLESRRWIWPPEHLLHTQASQFDITRELRPRGLRATGTLRTSLLNKLPGNEITQLEVNKKELRLPRFIAGVDGLTIGHISDLHFTGYYSLDMHHFIIDRLLELQPELIVITGDIIDYAHCLPWIETLLGRLRAPLGCTYVLGNHDKRIADVSEVTRRLSSLGHFDLGQADQLIRLTNQAQIYLAGNELPWFDRHQPAQLLEPFQPQPATATNIHATSLTGPDVLRLGLSHSPDQIVWARHRRLDLLLAGHTHGGQVRVPGLGPLVSPSRFGSRFASGVFYREPVLMHVSRGISGTHALRWRCLPEVSLLTLRS